MLMLMSKVSLSTFTLCESIFYIEGYELCVCDKIQTNRFTALQASWFRSVVSGRPITAVCKTILKFNLALVT